MATFLTEVMQKFVKWLDPKLEKFRARPTHRPTPAAAPAIYTPKTKNELMGLLKRTPEYVLNRQERAVIAAANSFKTTPVREIMLPENDITYVRSNEMLGPLKLDELYRSGFSCFPVLDAAGHIIGLLHTAALNSLQVREAETAKKFLDPTVYYMRDDYSLEMALAAFMRTGSNFFLVIDRHEKLVGLVTYEMLAEYLIGYTPKDDFSRDSSREAVARRS